MELLRKILPIIALLFLPFFFPNKSISRESTAHNYTRRIHSQIGVASWYGAHWHGKETASGERFNMHNYTAAHRSLPIGTIARVTNLENGKGVVVRINDRGPIKKGRIIDLSHAAAKSIGMAKDGTAKVKVDVIATPKGTRDYKNRTYTKG
jgi:peptidoglycan lytic transglycosylase